MSCNGMTPPFFGPGFLLQMQTPQGEDPNHPPLFPFPGEEYQGVATMLGKRAMSFSGAEEVSGEGDLSDDCSHGGERKRRLNVEQVKTLEKNFEMGNKLEPERKMQLARALGLQPRQIAIWFQNRRARWKTKQLEKDFDLLKRQFDAVKAENDALHSLNKKLLTEITALKCREATEPINLNKETEGSCSNRSENSMEENEEFPEKRQPLRIAATMAQLLHSSPKAEPGPQEESFCNMLCGLDDQPGSGFWAWSDNHSFH